jgi:hypothetical protein
MKRSHTGIAAREGHPQAPVGHPAEPVDYHKPGGPFCATCERRVHYRKRSYGPNGRAGGWSHTGDGLAQYRAW